MSAQTTIAASLAALSQTTPGRIQLFPAGAFRSIDIRPADAAAWLMTPVIAAAIIADVSARQTPLVIDYEHQTLKMGQNGQPAPAAGWIRSVEWIDDDGLYATVEWTATAANYIADGAYRFISPTFTYDPKTGAVEKLLHAALTNTPALDGMQAVFAALSQTLSPPQQENALDKEKVMELVRWMLNLPETVTDVECREHLARLISVLDGQEIAAASLSFLDDVEAQRTQMATLTQPDPTQYAPVAALVQLQTQVAALNEQMQRHADEEAQGLVTAALSDGRLLPALETWARDLARKDTAALQSYLDMTKPIAALTQTQTGGKAPIAAESRLNDGQLAACRALGMSEADYMRGLA